MTDGRRTISAMLLTLAFAATCTGCPPPPPPDDPVPEATCEATCAHWTELGCDQAKPTPGGASCVEVCENVMGSGGLMYWNLDCRVAVETCDEIDDCEQ